MPTPTYTPLATKTLTATATSVTFSSISQAYRDLVLVFTRPSLFAYAGIRFNNDATSSYSGVVMEGNGTAASSATYSGTEILDSYGGRRTNTTMYIMDYSATDKHKSVLHRSDLASSVTSAGSHRWASTSAVNNILVTGMFSETFAIGSTFTLYGIASA